MFIIILTKFVSISTICQRGSILPLICDLSLLQQKQLLKSCHDDQIMPYPEFGRRLKHSKKITTPRLGDKWVEYYPIDFRETKIFTPKTSISGHLYDHKLLKSKKL